MDKIRLPIKIITPGGKDWDAPKGGGGGTKVFGDPDEAFRKNLVEQIQIIDEYFSRSFREFPSLPAVAVVKLQADALAKSHRPDSLFRGSDCPIIGSRRSGELLIGVQHRFLGKLASSIMTGKSKTAIANISTISEISAYTYDDALQMAAAGNDNERHTVKLRPFNHTSPRANESLRIYLRQIFENLEVPAARQLTSYRSSPVYRLEGLRREHIVSLASFVGTRSVAEFPRYRVLRTSSRRLGPATYAMFAPPDKGVEYPILGIIDSGVDPNSAFLQPWVAARMWAVAANECDHSHGTFVGALAIHPRQLNNSNGCFPMCPCKLLDVVAFPKSGELPEDELLPSVIV
jgi:serine protease AprX